MFTVAIAAAMAVAITITMTIQYEFHYNYLSTRPRMVWRAASRLLWKFSGVPMLGS